MTPSAPDLPLLAKGKVREIYDLGDDLLMVASDRISTYDVVHPTPIPDKGRVLTGLSVLWFDLTKDIVANHFVSATDGVPDELRGRALRVKRLKMLPVECVVRGYITGSGWKDYQAHRHGLGHHAAGGAARVRAAARSRSTRRRRRPTSATTRRSTSTQTVELIGLRELAERRCATCRSPSTSAVADHARERGVILADTKFEFGLDDDGELVLGDEVCTPDSSRFWPADEYEPGHGQPSFDKQYVRDWASGTGWDKSPPAPAIPDDVVAQTRERYVTAYERLAGEPFCAWLERTGAA